jgi:hypothetical protein
MPKISLKHDRLPLMTGNLRTFGAHRQNKIPSRMQNLGKVR